MTIHTEHPFLPPEDERRASRRFRGRLVAPVTVWTSLDGRGRPVGWTVSSVLLADGDPPELLALLDPDADLTDALLRRRTTAVNVLTWAARSLADAFAGQSPAPGGPFTLATWTTTEWGPALDGAAWAGVRLGDATPEEVGWGLLVRATVEHVELGGAGAATGAALTHLRGRYHRVGD